MNKTRRNRRRKMRNARNWWLSRGFTWPPMYMHVFVEPVAYNIQERKLEECTPSGSGS